MNWYKISYENQYDDINSSDEFWINNGHAIYANADNGEGHEDIAIKHIFSLLGAEDLLGIEYDDLSEYNVNQVFEKLCEQVVGYEDSSKLDRLHPYIKDYILNLYEKFGTRWVNYIDFRNFAKQYHIDNYGEESFNNLNNSFRDARQYVMQYHDWQAVRGTFIELYKLDSRSLNSLSQGLEDAFPYANPQQKFTIEVVGDNPKTILYTTLEEIDNGDILKKYNLQKNPQKKNEPLLFDATEGAKNIKDQLRGIPGYKSPIYDNFQSGPKDENGKPFYKEVGANKNIFKKVLNIND